MHGQSGGQAQPTVYDVVAISHIGDLEVVQPSALLFDRQKVGHDLARMVEVGQPVDDWYGGVSRQLEQVLVVKKACHDHVVVTAEDACDILSRFALAHVDL